MPAPLCAAPNPAPACNQSSPPVDEPAVVCQQPRLHWRAVIFAGIVMSLLAAGITVAVGATDRLVRIDQKLQSLRVGVVPASLSKLPELPANPPPALELTTEDRTIPPVIVRSPPDTTIATTCALADVEPDRACSRPARESYGTAIEFLSQPTEAARQALHENKLLYLLHVSGNFEDAKFT